MRKFTPFLTSKYKVLIMLFDLILLVFAFVGVYFLRLGRVPTENLDTSNFFVVILLALISLYVYGTYDLDTESSSLRMFAKTSAAVITAILCGVIFNYIFALDRQGLFGRGILVGSLLLFGILAVLYRVATVQFFNGFRSEFNWLLLADDTNLPFFKADMGRRELLGHLTFLTEKTQGEGHGTWDEVETYLDRRWSGVICALKSASLEGKMGQTLARAKLAGHNVMSLSQFYELYWRKVPVYALSPEWFIAADSFNLVHNPVGLRVKRLWDLILSSGLLLVFWPVMLLVAVAIRLESAGPVIYRQIRSGKDGNPFEIYKFRSMVQDAEKAGAQWATAKDARVTRVGKFIRATRLDELPQLFNVFKGDMSFIGPRPERPEFNTVLEAEIPHYDLRHLVRPGITGWAQVSYPYGASIEDAREKLQYDLYYIKHYSLTLDFIIVLRTVRVVLFGKGAR